MKKLYLFISLCSILAAKQATAQCLPGYTQAQLNWDFRDYLVSSGNYSPYVTAARAANQRFTIGTNAVAIAYSGSTGTAITNNGETANHTADAGSDLEYSAVPNAGETATITLTFDDEVTNLRFSIYDIDRRQRVAVNGKDVAAVDVTTTIVKRNVAGLILTLTPLTGVGTNPSALATNTSVANNNHDGTIDVTMTGPVKTVTLSISNSGDVSSTPLFLASITACVTGSFPTGYRAVSRPFTGMPAYILTVVDNEFKLLDPATGRIKHLFTDPGHTNMNGMAYDPYNRILYYTYSLMGSTAATLAEKTIYKYDANTGTISTFVADVNAAPLNIPTYNPGVTSGSASFYNGSLYFGVEASNSSRNSGRENTVWKIDFDGTPAQNPIRATQVYASRVDSNISGNDRLIHDWSDIGVTNNGILYDFDGSGAGTSNLDSMYYHFDMVTGQRTQFAPGGAGNFSPKQVAIDWQENVYNMGGLPAPAGSGPGQTQNIGGFIVPYNYNGTVNNAQNRLVYSDGPVYPTGSWGDCSEAFRPLCDFGDAPASYDPDPLSPAVNELDTALRMGRTFDREWLKTTSALADADGTDEDGVGTVPVFSNLYSTYAVQDSVYNNTGAPATVMGWLDYNGNGLFDAGEASAPVTVPSGTSMQNIYLSWTGISSPLASSTYTYLRIRITSAAYGMGFANATGWFDSGETEDYRVLVNNIVLPITIISFEAKAVNNSIIKLNWAANEDINFPGYEVQRSRNGIDWEKVAFVAASHAGGKQKYELTDNNPYKGTTWYRLKFDESNGHSKYSEMRTVKITDQGSFVTLSPNPAVNKSTVTINNSLPGETAHIRVMDANGNQLLYQKLTLSRGNNTVELPAYSWSSGTYIVLVNTSEGATNKKLVIKK